MDEKQDFSELSRQLKEGIQNAVDSAKNSMDFSKLNDMISGTVQDAVDEVTGALHRTFDQKERKNSWEGRAEQEESSRREEGSGYNNARQRYHFQNQRQKTSWNADQSTSDGKREKRERSIWEDGKEGWERNTEAWRRNAKSWERNSESWFAEKGRTAERSDSTIREKDERYGELYGRVSGILYTVFGAIGLGTFGIALLSCIIVALAMLGSFPSYILGLTSAVVLLPLTIAFSIMMGKGIKKVGRINRFRRYVRMIGEKNICALKTLAQSVGKSIEYAEKDLQQMIDLGFFRQGHLDDEKSCMMLTDQTYEYYLQSKERIRQARQEEASQKKQEEEQKKETELERTIREAIAAGQEYIGTIRSVNEELPDPVISEKLERLERVIVNIYSQIQRYPQKLPEIKRFTDYYLPTTIKLVEAYREFEKESVQTQNIQRSKEEILKTLDTINAAFEKLLDSLYEDISMDLAADISVLQTLLAQEGLVDDGMFRKTSE